MASRSQVSDGPSTLTTLAERIAVAFLKIEAGLSQTDPQGQVVQNSPYGIFYDTSSNDRLSWLQLLDLRQDERQIIRRLPARRNPISMTAHLRHHTSPRSAAR